MTAQPTPCGLARDGIEPIRLPREMRPTLVVMIDTEEEFDWDAPFSRTQTSVRHMRLVGRVQDLFDRYRVRPTYVIDYPVASQPDGYEPLRELVARGRCVVGAHLHPWVTPPHSEPVNGRNSFACNLTPELERRKLESLTAAIAEHIGIAPRIYKAGRYGIGASTVPALAALGFTIDQSVMPHMDFSSVDGPSFREFDAAPFWFAGRQLLELPCTSAYFGMAGPAARAVHDLASLSSLAWARLVGIAARLRVSERVVLTPEGFTLSEMRRLTAALLRRGDRLFVLTFHSPSIDPGHTPYVRTAGDLDTFLSRLDGYFDYFFGSLAGAATTPEEFRATVAT